MSCIKKPHSAAFFMHSFFARFTIAACFSANTVMIFQLNIYAPPWSSNATEKAVAFAQQALADGHEIKRVFFFFDGVYHGLSTQSPASDEFNQLAQWQALANQGVELLICIAAAANRGILNAEEAQRYEQKLTTCDDCFEITGLGQWAAGFHDADRILSFK